MTNKKTALMGLICIICMGMLAACDNRAANPMQYMLSQNESYNSDNNDSSSEDDKEDTDKDIKQAVNVVSTTDNIEDVYKDITEINSVDVRISQLVSLQKGKLETNEMLDISKKVFSILDSSDSKGVVIVHDEQTVEELGYFLELTLKTKKPVVIVPLKSEIKDITSVINTAVMVADTKDVADKGVVVLNNNNLYQALYVGSETICMENASKSDNGYIGNVNKNTVVLEDKSNKNYDNTFDISSVKEFPEVQIIYDYQGIDSQTYEKAFNRNDGIVIVTSSGNGKLSETAKEIIGSSTIPPVVLTTGNIRVDNSKNVYDNVINAGQMSPVKARMLLMLSINSGKKDNEGIQKIFNQY